MTFPKVNQYIYLTFDKKATLDDLSILNFNGLVLQEVASQFSFYLRVLTFKQFTSFCDTSQ